MGNPWHDLFIFIGLLVLLFVVWVGTGGPERATEGPTVRSAGIFTTLRDSRSTKSAEERLTELAQEGVASPYRDLVSFSGGDPKERLVAEEYVRIRASRKLDSPINITGWQIESLITGVSYTIPGASALPFIGSVNSESPLLLDSGDTVIINSGRSPLGISFRNNMCTTYLDRFQRFTPRLPRQCPDPEDEFLEFSNIAPTGVRDEDYDQCRIYIDRNIDRCETVTKNLRARDTEGNFIIEPPLTDQCISFIQNDLTYQGCVTNHRSDESFFDDEWRVFLGSFAELWREDDDVLRLLDQSGRIVDVWQY